MTAGSVTPGVRRVAALLAWIGVIAGFWLVALPGLGAVPWVRAHVDLLDAARVDASAMFYSDLDPSLLPPLRFELRSLETAGNGTIDD